MGDIFQRGDSGLDYDPGQDIIFLPQNQTAKRFNGILDFIHIPTIHWKTNEHEPAFSVKQNPPGIWPPIMLGERETETVMNMRDEMYQAISVWHTIEANKSLTSSKGASLNLNYAESVFPLNQIKNAVAGFCEGELTLILWTSTPYELKCQLSFFLFRSQNTLDSRCTFLSCDSYLLSHLVHLD